VIAGAYGVKPAPPPTPRTGTTTRVPGSGRAGLGARVPWLRAGPSGARTRTPTRTRDPGSRPDLDSEYEYEYEYEHQMGRT